MSTVEKRRLTPEEYLAIERKADFKSEFYRGEMFAMAGASRRHNLIASNLVIFLGQQLRGRRCEVYSGDMRVRVTATGLYTYPDVTVVCGKPEFLDEREDTLLNPTVLFEVLSPSTEAYDRTTKFEQYTKLDSLKEYILVAQEAPSVLRYTRQADGQWLVKIFSELGERVEIASIDCQLTLGEIYEKVEFDAEEQVANELRPERD